MKPEEAEKLLADFIQKYLEISDSEVNYDFIYEWLSENWKKLFKEKGLYKISELENACRRLESLSIGCEDLKNKTNHELHLEQIGEILLKIIEQIETSIYFKNEQSEEEIINLSKEYAEGYMLGGFIDKDDNPAYSIERNI